MKAHICFISCVKNPKRFWLDPSFRYRCENLGLALQKQGYPVSYRHLKSSWKIPNTDVAVFHRPRDNWHFRWLFWRLQKQGVTCLADVDDLVFDPKMANYSPGFLNQQHPLEVLQKQFTEHHQAFSRFNKITVSTKPLQEDVQHLFPTAKSLVLPNAVHESWKLFDHEYKKTTHQDKIITYLPGTPSHDRDFLIFSDGLAQFLSEHPEIKLEITGALTLPNSFPRQQTITRPRVPFEQYHQHLQHSWVNLMPLEDTPFTQCKSALKIIEAGYWNIPTLASPNPDTLRFDQHGAEIIYRSNDVYTHLKKLLDDEHYIKASHHLRKTMEIHANANSQVNDWLAFVNLN